MSARDKYTNDLVRERTREMLNVLDLAHSGLDESLSNRLTDILYQKSTGERMNYRIQELLHLYNMSQTELICSCMAVKSMGTYSIYGYLYSQWNSTKQVYEHKYICASPTYHSQDGEYRHRLIPFWQWEALQKRFEDVFSIAETYVLQKMENGDYEFNTVIFYPKIFTGDQQTFENDIDGRRLPIYVYTLAWMYDFHQIHDHVVENHINPAYQYIVYQEDGLPVYNEITSKLLSMGVSYSEFTYYISTLQQNVNAPINNIPLDCGQKIIPMTRGELIHAGDIRFQIWREIYISRLCCDLVVNFTSPSFPFINKFFYIQNTFEALYDNPSQHEKYENSNLAGEVSNLLSEADRLNFKDGSKATGNYINAKFHNLSRKVNHSIKYARDSIRLTDVAICITSEWTGRTLRDTTALAAFEKSTNMYAKLYSSADIFKKHVFEYLYAFYSMNKKLGVIHGDLHLNNATLYTNVQELDANPNTPNPTVCYIVDYGNGKSQTYKFIHNGVYSVIIDMSRSIVSDRQRLERDFGKRSADMYMLEQNKRALHLLLHYFPTSVERHREKTEHLIATNFELVFRLLTLVDPFSIFKNLEIMFQVDLPNLPELKVDPLIAGYLREVTVQCENIFTRLFDDVVSDRITSPDDIEWPCLSVIKLLFDDSRVYKAEDLNDCTIVDVFSQMNPLKYSVRSYDTMHELLRLDIENRLRVKYGIDIQENIDAVELFKRGDEPDKMRSLMQKYETDPSTLLPESEWMFE